MAASGVTSTYDSWLAGQMAADREKDALDCAARRRERESRPVNPDLYMCRCDHDHPPGVIWCDLCEFPVYGLGLGHG